MLFIGKNITIKRLSSKSMAVIVQESKGWDEIQRHVHQLEKNHLQHLMVYGSCNALRHVNGTKLPGSNLQFTWGLEDRAASLRIPHSSFLHRKGWYEDRRPAADMDPYLVTPHPPGYIQYTPL
jgi:glutamine synthetase